MSTLSSSALRPVTDDESAAFHRDGAVLIKLNTLDGQACCYQRSFDLITGDRKWMVLVDGPEPDVDASITKQCSFDPDLWVIEVEDKQGRHLLDEPDLA